MPPLVKVNIAWLSKIKCWPSKKIDHHWETTTSIFVFQTMPACFAKIMKSESEKYTKLLWTTTKIKLKQAVQYSSQKLGLFTIGKFDQSWSFKLMKAFEVLYICNISQKKRNMLISFKDYPENLYINIESYKLSNFVISSTMEEEANLIQNWKDFLVKGASTNWKSLERNWNWIFSNYLVYFGLDPNPSKRQSVFQ